MARVGPVVCGLATRVTLSALVPERRRSRLLRPLAGPTTHLPTLPCEQVRILASSLAPPALQAPVAGRRGTEASRDRPCLVCRGCDVAELEAVASSGANADRHIASVCDRVPEAGQPALGRRLLTSAEGVEVSCAEARGLDHLGCVLVERQEREALAGVGLAQPARGCDPALGEPGAHEVAEGGGFGQRVCCGRRVVQTRKRRRPTVDSARNHRAEESKRCERGT